jgi:MSHA biogenesis protein MshQ
LKKLPTEGRLFSPLNIARAVTGFIVLTELIAFKSSRLLGGIGIAAAAVKAGLHALLGLLLLSASSAALAVAVSAWPTTCVSLGGANQNWTNTNRAQAQDSSYATASVNDGQVTDPLQCTGYGFAIPSGAVINGITVTVWRYASATSCCTDAQMQMVKAGTIQATDNSTTTYYPTANASEAHGSATDLWGTTWTSTDINDPNFGAVFAAQKPVTSGGGRTVSVDAVQITVDYTTAPTVLSINTVSTNPTAPATAVAWTVVFSSSVTGVNATDFALVQGGGVTGATITSVTGSGTTWTVNANTGSGTGTLGLNLVDDDSIVGGGQPLGGAGAGNGNFTGQVYTVPAPFCSPPSNIPAGVTVTCVCDQFGRASLNPSTIFGGNWTLSYGATDSARTNPYINATTGLLRLTENTNNNAKAATVPSIFPAVGNYISVEFNNYAYQGGNTGADGIAVTLSDYTIPAAPGGFGGSLGYAQRTDSTPNPPGFAGGWVGIALDEYGNFQNPTEGRIGGPGARAQSVGVRGPGSGASGYRYMGGSASNPGGLSISANSTSATPATGYMYQVIVDARNAGTGTINVAVNRDATTKDGSSYASVFGPFNAYTEANYALGQGWITQLVPDYWKISFTGSTGGSTNVHEIGSLRICAQSVFPASGGTASGFSAIDEAYTGSPVPVYSNFQTGDIYTKLTGTAFKLWVAALTSTAISNAYSATSNKYVQVKVVDNSDNACGPDSARTCNSTCTNKTAVETGATQIALFPSGSSTGVASPSPSFTLNSSYKNLITVMKECTTSACTAFTAATPACSADSFSVRPLNIVSVTSSNATNTTMTGTPIFKAGGDNFSLTATTTGVAGNPSGYNGVMKINNAVVQPVSPATVAGAISGSFPAETSATASSTAAGSTFTYSEVGGFTLPGYNPSTDTTSRRGVFDGVSSADECAPLPMTPAQTAQCDALKAATWTGVDSVSTKGDCVADSYLNTKNAAGKYGCSFGLLANTATIGRFVPYHFALSSASLVNRSDICPAGTGCPSTFTYMGEQMKAIFSLTAQAAGNTTTKNYVGALAKLNPAASGNPLGLATSYAANNMVAAAAGATTLTVDSTVGFVIGDALWIPKAGAAGAALAATVTNLTNNTITLNTSIVTALPAGASTTGAINAASSNLVVGSASGMSIGDTITISGAGLAGADLIVNVTAIAGTSITVTPAAVTTVSGAAVIKIVPVERDLNARLDTSVAATGSFSAGVANIIAPLMVTRGATTNYYPVLDVGIAPVEGDGVLMATLDLDASTVVGNDHARISRTDLRYGRMKIANAHGSELLQLPIPITAQYWNGLNYATNSADSATTLNVTLVSSSNWNNITPGSVWPKLSVTSTWAAGATSVVPATASVVFVNGASSFRLIAPGQNKTGSVDMTTNAPNYLLTDTTARATFGVYKGANEFIYLRENY